MPHTCQQRYCQSQPQWLKEEKEKTLHKEKLQYYTFSCLLPCLEVPLFSWSKHKSCSVNVSMQYFCRVLLRARKEFYNNKWWCILKGFFRITCHYQYSCFRNQHTACQAIQKDLPIPRFRNCVVSFFNLPPGVTNDSISARLPMI